jgi:hypothetical protein
MESLQTPVEHSIVPFFFSSFFFFFCFVGLVLELHQWDACVFYWILLHNFVFVFIH